MTLDWIHQNSKNWIYNSDFIFNQDNFEHSLKRFNSNLSSQDIQVIQFYLVKNGQAQIATKNGKTVIQ